MIVGAILWSNEAVGKCDEMNHVWCWEVMCWCVCVFSITSQWWSVPFTMLPQLIMALSGWASVCVHTSVWRWRLFDWYTQTCVPACVCYIRFNVGTFCFMMCTKGDIKCSIKERDLHIKDRWCCRRPIKDSSAFMCLSCSIFTHSHTEMTPKITDMTPFKTS